MRQFDYKPLFTLIVVEIKLQKILFFTGRIILLFSISVYIVTCNFSLHIKNSFE